MHLGHKRSAGVVSSFVLSVFMVLLTPLIATAPGAIVSAAAPPGFVTSGLKLRVLPEGSLPYQRSRPMALAGDGLVDDTGVRMFWRNGRSWNHPVAQAQYALRSLDSYRLTGTQAYLDRAIANAQRLIDRRVEVYSPFDNGFPRVVGSGVAWFYPYPFNFPCCQGDSTMVLRAPWYSAMAQGQALSVFTRLFQVTGDASWRVAADATFASLLVTPSADRPWVVWVDGVGHLWLEEYPRWPVDTSERVLNGQVFAAFGVYDYFLLTHDQRAAQLFDGAVTTAEELLPSRFRRVGQAAAYSLQHGIPEGTYQQILVSQFLYLQHMTGHNEDALLADKLRDDFPVKTSRGTGVFTRGTTVAYKLDFNRNILKKRNVVLRRQTSAPVDRRERTRSGAIMLHVSAGPFKNWWFREQVGAAWIAGPVDDHDYGPLLTATFSPGTFEANSFDASGNLTGHQWLTVTETTEWLTDSSAIVNGTVAYHVTSGPFAGSWAPATPAIAVR